MLGIWPLKALLSRLVLSYDLHHILDQSQEAELGQMYKASLAAHGRRKIQGLLPPLPLPDLLRAVSVEVVAEVDPAQHHQAAARHLVANQVQVLRVHPVLEAHHRSAMT